MSSKRKASPSAPAAKRQAAQQGQGGGVGAGGHDKPAPAPVFAPTVDDIAADPLTDLAAKYWAPAQSRSKGQDHEQLPFDPKVIENVYKSIFSTKNAMMLEFSCYLENYLWPNFTAASSASSSTAHIMSMLCMINLKFREAVPAWDCFHQNEEAFPSFLFAVLRLWGQNESMTPKEKDMYIVFLMNLFRSLEDSMVRKQTLRLVSMPLWRALNPVRREQELGVLPQLQKHWRALKRRDVQLQKKAEAANALATDVERYAQDKLESRFVIDLIHHFLKILGQDKDEDASFLEHFVALLIDLLSELPTRRFLRAVVEDAQIVVRCRMAPIMKRSAGKELVQLVERLRFFVSFPIDDHSGEAQSESQVESRHCAKIQALQRVAYRSFRDDNNDTLRNVAMSHVGALETREGLTACVDGLNLEQLVELCAAAGLWSSRGGEGTDADAGEDWLQGADVTREFLIEILVHEYERVANQSEEVEEMPFYPTDDILWNDSLLPSNDESPVERLSLPKLNLQFLTVHDYLLRNFILYRLESAYEIREDLQDVVMRLRPSRDKFQPGAPLAATYFKGWAKMAVPIQAFEVKKVARPLLGEKKPSEVVAEVTYTVQGMRGAGRHEWSDAFRRHDVVFLLTIEAPRAEGEAPPANILDALFPQQWGVKCIRGGEVIDVIDGFGNVREENARDPTKSVQLRGDQRTLKLQLDPSQYQVDMAAAGAGRAPNVYTTFNVLVRRKAKENNFKAVLETIRSLMTHAQNTGSLPQWLHDIFLGYGDPAAVAELKSLDTINFRDTFLDFDHCVESFPSKAVVLDESFEGSASASASTTTPRPPFTVKFESERVVVKPYVQPYPGPYPFNQPRRNRVRFTPAQVEAIRQGVQPGLTMIEGPPGTGKTDVAVQIIQQLYHNFPDQRIVLVTHSNQALNQLFEKIMELDIDERHLLRLGHGEEMLETRKDYSKWGRINYLLSRRMALLKEANRLAATTGVTHYDVGQSCETAEHFYHHHVANRWKAFDAEMDLKAEAQFIVDKFPFHDFFANAPQPIFPPGAEVPFEVQADIARGCWRHIDGIFEELRELHAFELLRTGYDRTNYMLIKQARIIAMTCTHAAISRSHLIDIGFKYDTLVMEEAAQVLEVETFIPMMLQTPDEGVSRLKRVVLIGDHNQLPPVVQNLTLQKYGHLEQSLFTRFVRLGVPHVLLDAQGRSRPSIARLYNWRYGALGDLPFIHKEPSYAVANAGFANEFQFVNVEGQESAPNPHFFQNVAEAEYVVATYMYMRLLGYPASSITILTTYNGQKHLIRDVVGARCRDQVFGFPRKITTVDRYQGQENDYVLLSLVKTKTVGHIRDVRRLVVAMSRARYGLYIFGKLSLFENTWELKTAFKVLNDKVPADSESKLALAVGEVYPTSRAVIDTGKVYLVNGVEHMVSIVATMYNQRQGQMVAPTPVAAADAESAKAEAGAEAGGEGELA